MQDGKCNELGHFFPDVNFVSVANTWEYVVAINPFGIDLSSGVEKELGIKDNRIINNFIGKLEDA